jgi:hypothetical protein
MDDTTKPTEPTPGSDADQAAATPASGSSADETFGWSGSDDPSAASSGDTRAAAERMLAQLQSMIDQVATQAAPVVRQIGAKAAELAAIAADRAGPLAHKAADATADASERLAEKSRTWAADLRNRVTDGDENADAESSASTSLGGADDATETAARDDPAEGPAV